MIYREDRNRSITDCEVNTRLTLHCTLEGTAGGDRPYASINRRQSYAFSPSATITRGWTRSTCALSSEIDDSPNHSLSTFAERPPILSQRSAFVSQTPHVARYASSVSTRVSTSVSHAVSIASL